MAEMTFREAADILRSHYDMWRAAARLHEALEKAADAERLLARKDDVLRTLEQEAATVTDAVLAKRTELEHLTRILEQRERASLESAKADAEQQVAQMLQAAKVSLADMTEEIGRASQLADAWKVEGARLEQEVIRLREQEAALTRSISDLRTELKTIRGRFAEI